MINSEVSSLDVISQSARQLVFDHLLDEGRLGHYLHRKLCTLAGLHSIDDLCQKYVSIQDFIDRNEGAGKKTANELLIFLRKIEESNDSCDMLNKEYDNLIIISGDVHSKEVLELSFGDLYRQNIISKILFNKLCRDARLQTVGDFYRQFTTPIIFQRKTVGVGKRVVEELIELLKNISSTPFAYLKAIEKEKNVYLPLGYTEDESIVENLKRLINDIKIALSFGKGRTDQHYVTILEYFFSDAEGKRQYTLEEVGGILCLHKERVRQLKADFINEFTKWVLENSNDLVPKRFIIADLSDRIQIMYKRLINRFPNIATETELCAFLNEENIDFNNLNSRTISLLFGIYGINRCGKSETKFTDANFYITNSDFDHKSFLAISSIILDELKEEVIPINRNDLIIRINKSLKKYNKNHFLKPGKIPHFLVDLALEMLPEIEVITDGNEPAYQIKYSFLSSNPDRVERILYELGGLHSFSEIISQMRSRADSLQLDKSIEEVSIRNQTLQGKSRVRAHGKLGLYEWVSPDKPGIIKAQSRVELVKTALKNKGEACTLTEIEQYINEHLAAINAFELKNLKSTSGVISYLINQNQLIRLNRGQYILKNWEPRYADQIDISNPLRNPKGKIRTEVIEILSSIPDRTLPRRVLSRRLLEAGYPRSTITPTLANNPVLDLFEKDGIWFTRLKDNHNIFFKPQQRDQILASIIDLLLTTKNHTLPLTVVVRKLEKEFALSKSQLPVVYKVVTANPHIFDKSESLAGQKSLTLLAVPKSSDVSFSPVEHWPELKKKLVTKLDLQVSGIFIRSLEETLEVFFNVAMMPNGEADLEALDLLPGYIWKFFSGMADEHFEHSLVREIATSIEPYILKILYLASADSYEAYKNEQNKGLSRINYLLSRVKYGHSQRLRDAFCIAKKTRDAAAHTARSWSTTDRNDRVLSCLVQMLYTVDCYFVQLQKATQDPEKVD